MTGDLFTLFNLCGKFVTPGSSYQSEEVNCTEAALLQDWAIPYIVNISVAVARRLKPYGIRVAREPYAADLW